MSLNIYSWIPSSKVAEYLRQNRTFTLLEKYQLIYDAPRPLEEKLEALLKLETEATEEREKAFLGQALEVYQFAIRLMKEAPPGSLFLVKAFSDTEELVGATPYATFEQVLAQAENDRRAARYMAELWQPTPSGSLLDTLLYTLLPYEGKLQATNFYMDDALLPFAPLPRIDETYAPNTDDLFDSHLYVRCLLPFDNGDLVCLEVDGISKHGVFYQELDGNGTLYAYLGYLHNGHLDLEYLGENTVMKLNWTRLRPFCGELRPEEGVLQEIGNFMKRVEQKEPAAVGELFLDKIFRLGFKRECEYTHYYHKTFLSLADILEQRHCEEYQKYLG